MKVKGSLTYEQIKPFISDAKTLDSQKVKHGEIYVRQNESGTTGVLYLGPGAAIRYHRHVNESEKYYDPHSAEEENCPKGGYHSLENTSTMWAMINFFKY